MKEEAGAMSLEIAVVQWVLTPCHLLIITSEPLVVVQDISLCERVFKGAELPQ